VTSIQQSVIPYHFSRDSTLNERLNILHERILETHSIVDRISVAIYDAPDDLLRTFIQSTRDGNVMTLYEYPLADSSSLSALAQLGESRVVNDIPVEIASNSPHSLWLKNQGYRASFTLPIYNNGAFMGFVFFDSKQSFAFTPEIQRELNLYSSLINMSICSEFAAIRSIMASVKVARDFANLRDFETGKHLERMSRYAHIIARSIAPAHKLSDEFVEHIFLFAPLHDIGKIGIPDSVLLKNGQLDADERRVMESHVIKGCEIVTKVLGEATVNHLPDSRMMMNIVKYHHELLDGSGYPDGLQGDEIPIEVRIVTVADIFDALTSKRPYKKVWTIKEAFIELNNMVNAGMLAADCVAALAAHSDEAELICERYQDLSSEDWRQNFDELLAKR
jgi:HD-GYP domain-containing protein (c-di-GMP phosphodiesterase class II)